MAIKLSSNNALPSDMKNALCDFYSTLKLPKMMDMAKRDVYHNQLELAHFYFELAMETMATSDRTTSDIVIDTVMQMMYTKIVNNSVDESLLLSDVDCWLVAEVASKNSSEQAIQMSTFKPGIRDTFLCFERFLKQSLRYKKSNARNNLLFYNDVLQLEQLCTPGMEERYVERYLQIYATYFASSDRDGRGAIKPIDLDKECRKNVVNYHEQLISAVY